MNEVCTLKSAGVKSGSPNGENCKIKHTVNFTKETVSGYVDLGKK